jgi:hypothetical protein
MAPKKAQVATKKKKRYAPTVDFRKVRRVRPTILNVNSPTFRQEILAALEKDNYAVIRVHSPGRAAKYYDAYLDWIESVSPGFEKNDPSTHIPENIPYNVRGIIFSYGAGHLPAKWQLRANEKIRKAFAAIYDVPMTELVTSFDGFNFQPALVAKPKGTMWPHIDRTPNDRDFNKYVQGLYQLTPSLHPNSAAFVIYPGANKNDWMKLDPTAKIPKNMGSYMIPQEYPQVALDKAEALALDAGTFVLFNGPHCNIPPTAPGHPGARSYECMWPRSWLTENQIKERVKLFKSHQGTSHKGVPTPNQVYFLPRPQCSELLKKPAEIVAKLEENSLFTDPALRKVQLGLIGCSSEKELYI